MLNNLKAYLRTVLVVAWKDLTVEWHSRETISAVLVFALVVIFLFNFALDLDSTLRAGLSAGVLWVTFAFSGTLGLNRSMAAERENNCFDGLLLAPVDRSAIYLGKVLAAYILMLVTAAILLPVYSLLYNQNLFLPNLLVVIALGSLGYSAVGTLLAGLAAQTRTKDLLLPVLLFPVALPVLVAAVYASRAVLEGSSLDALGYWTGILVIYDLVFLALAILVYDSLVED